MQGRASPPHLALNSSLHLDACATVVQMLIRIMLSLIAAHSAIYPKITASQKRRLTSRRRRGGRWTISPRLFVPSIAGEVSSLPTHRSRVLTGYDIAAIAGLRTWGMDNLSNVDLRA